MLPIIQLTICIPVVSSYSHSSSSSVVGTGGGGGRNDGGPDPVDTAEPTITHITPSPSLAHSPGGCASPVLGGITMGGSARWAGRGEGGTGGGAAPTRSS